MSRLCQHLMKECNANIHAEFERQTMMPLSTNEFDERIYDEIYELFYDEMYEELYALVYATL